MKWKIQKVSVDYRLGRKWSKEDLTTAIVWFVLKTNLGKCSITVKKTKHVDHYAYMIPHREKAFTVYLNREDFTIGSLFHELVHIHQIVSGRFQLGVDMSVWDGELYNNYLPYRKLPWEADAFKRELDLVRLWNQEKIRDLRGCWKE